MRIDEIKAAARVLMRAGIPLLIEGLHGIGKSSAIIQLFAEEASARSKEKLSRLPSTLDGKTYSDVGPDEFGLWSFSAGSILAEELIGVPVPQSDGTVKYHVPHGVLPPPNHRGGGIVLIDELNRADQQVRNAVMQLVLDRRLFSYKVPDGIWFAATQNPPSPEYQTTRMNPAIIERFCLLYAEYNDHDASEFIGNISKVVSSAMGLSAGTRNPSVNYTQRIRSARSWEMAARIERSHADIEFDSKGMLGALTGVVGNAAATVIVDAMVNRVPNESVKGIIAILDEVLSYGVSVNTVRKIREMGPSIVQISRSLTNMAVACAGKGDEQPLCDAKYMFRNEIKENKEIASFGTESIRCMAAVALLHTATDLRECAARIAEHVSITSRKQAVQVDVMMAHFVRRLTVDIDPIRKLIG